MTEKLCVKCGVNPQYVLPKTQKPLSWCRPCFNEAKRKGTNGQVRNQFKPGHVPHNKKPEVDHGDVEMYWRGCRCDTCGLANTKYYAELNGRLTLAENKAKPCKDCGINPQMPRCRVCRECYNEKARTDANRKNRIQTQEEYDAMFAAQNGLCAICKCLETAMANRNGKVRELAEDHDHNTGEVRGLLCSKHNIGLGLFGDDIELLEAAIEYLKRSK